MYKLLLVVSLSMTLLVGCVKLEVKPQNVIKETVGASKSLYNTVKRKRNNEEEVAYSHKIPAPQSAVDSATINRCHDHLTAYVRAQETN